MVMKRARRRRLVLISGIPRRKSEGEEEWEDNDEASEKAEERRRGRGRGREGEEAEGKSRGGSFPVIFVGLMPSKIIFAYRNVE